MFMFDRYQKVIDRHKTSDLSDSQSEDRTVRLMSEHVAVDTSGLLQREINLDQAGDRLLECMLRTANGRLTAAEALGHREFALTRLYESA
jgi:(2R)-sulfolactate sulfo-lyase subunit beta